MSTHYVARPGTGKTFDPEYDDLMESELTAVMTTRTLIEAIKWPDHEFSYEVLPEEPETNLELAVPDPTRTDAYVDGPLYKAVEKLFPGTGFGKEIGGSGCWEMTYQGLEMWLSPYFDWYDQFQVMIFSGNDADAVGNPEQRSYVTAPLELVANPERDARYIKELVNAAIARYNAGDPGDY